MQREVSIGSRRAAILKSGEMDRGKFSSDEIGVTGIGRQELPHGQILHRHNPAGILTHCPDWSDPRLAEDDGYEFRGRSRPNVWKSVPA